jgi:hypothetical protein
MRRQAVGLEGGHSGGHAFGVDVVDDDLHALFGQPARGGRAQPAGRAGDDGDLVLESQIHGVCLLSTDDFMPGRARSPRPLQSSLARAASRAPGSDAASVTAVHPVARDAVAALIALAYFA